MGLFAYRAKGSDGLVLEGTIEAEEKKSAMDSLRARKLVVLDLVQREATPWERVRALFNRGAEGVPPKELVLFSRQLSTMVSTGVPIVRGLGVLERQTKNPTLKAALGAVRADIEGGLSISEALQRHRDVFPPLYISMVKAGELGGILDVVLDRLSAYLESAEILRAKVRSALMYPMIVLGVCGGVTVFLLVFVIPRFEAIFAGFGSELPLLTQLLVDLSRLVQRFFILVVAAPFAARWAFRRYYATPEGQARVARALLELPIFGELMRKAAIARVARTLSTLVKSGVPMLPSLETAAETADNVVIAAAIRAARESVRDGGSLSVPLEKSGVFPEMVSSMIATGEETGALDTMLAKIADFYEQEIDTDVKGLASMIEPLVIVLMGVIVGTIVIAMFWPIFDLPNATEKL